MSKAIPPVDCKCGSKTMGALWSKRARGYVVRCLNPSCPATAQAKTKGLASAIWNQTATKI